MSKEKEDKEEGSSKWTCDGSKEEDWDAFDRRVLRHMRKHYGLFGEKLWQGSLPKIDDLGGDDYNQYCEEVYETVEIKDPTNAWHLWDVQSGFWTKVWQEKWRARQYMLLKDYVEEHARGAVEIEVVNFDGDEEQLRSHLFKQFGAGNSGDVHSKESHYDAGMPEPGKMAFPIGVDMRAKLRQLHDRKQLFWKMCAPDLRSEYPYCKETKLVRIVLEHVGYNSDYKECVARLLSSIALKKEIVREQSGEGVEDDPDPASRTFNDDWLPSWSRLQYALVEEYVKIEKAKPPSKKLPVALAGNNSGGGGENGQLRCYACGKYGHKVGAPECLAEKGDIHASAPEGWKARKKNQAVQGGGGSSSSNSPASKKHCRLFNFGKGQCSYGSGCKFLHSTSKPQSISPGGAGKGKFNKSQKKQMSVMVANELKRLITNAGDGKKGKKAKRDESSGEGLDLAAIVSSVMIAGSCDIEKIPKSRSFTGNDVPVISSQLHDTSSGVGVDSDAALSMSMFSEDFIYIDSSPEAIARVPGFQGVGDGKAPKVGGVGPYLVRHADTGEYLLDPEGVYLLPSPGQPKFRIISMLRFKALGVRLVSCFKNTEADVLQCRKTSHDIKLSAEGHVDHNGLPRKILIMPTKPCPKVPVTNKIKRLVRDVLTGKRSAMITNDLIRESDKPQDWPTHGMALSGLVISMLLASVVNTIKVSSMVFNEAKLDENSRSRLYSRKFGCCDTSLFERMNKMEEHGDFPKMCALNEDSLVQVEAKFKRKPYTKNDPAIKMNLPCWHRTYVDGYGGGDSLGGESYEGAVGGYLFVCASTGDKHHKLYSSHEQFPIALFQFLVHVESEGHRCCEIYVDTFAVNVSAEAEEVVAMFHCKIVPVSAGSPQEVSFVEKGHDVVAGRSRAMMLNAPHLPKWCWALADKYSVYVGRYLPQSTRKWMSSYFLNTGKVPHWRTLCLHVFGAPCKYADIDGPVHKRASMTEDGFFVGVQYPMALVLRKHDMKLISVSTKKIKVFESMYTIPLDQKLPNPETYQHAEIINDEGPSEKVLNQPEPEETPQEVGGRVRSVKSVREHTIPLPHTSAATSFRDPTLLDESAQSMAPYPGEGEFVPEHRSYSRDKLASDLRKMEQEAKSVADPSIRDKVVSAIRKARSEASNEIERGRLKVGKKTKRDGDVSTDNIVSGKRKRGSPNVSGKRKKGSPIVSGNRERGPSGGFSWKLPSGASGSAARKRGTTMKHAVVMASTGDLVSSISRYGAELNEKDLHDGGPGIGISKHPEKYYGVVTQVKDRGSRYQISWMDGIHTSEVPEKDIRLERKKLTSANILSILLIEGSEAKFEASDKKNWPKDFFEALVKSDWREWIAAVKKEIDSWNEFNAYTEIDIGEKTQGASIVPLGELYTRKRDLSYKFRQYLMGNLLKHGRDFYETFSSTVSWDGIRWCASVACATNKQIYGLDAVTGFLQASEKFDLYAFIPSHGNYSNLSYEDLAILREQLLELVNREGEQGLKKFAQAHKKESRCNPKTCYRLNSSIYGSPSANYEWEALFQGAHRKDCGFTISEVEPALFIKIDVDESGNVAGWLIAKIWTDDVRYFGTEMMRKQYEEVIGRKIKVKFLGVPKEFVGTEFNQDLTRGLCELKCPEYWTKAEDKFRHLFPNGQKERLNVLTPYDEKALLEKVTDEECQQAAHLPFRELVGVISYPAACSKLEMRYCVSMLGRYRSRWGHKQFAVALKAFEYGCTTKDMGIIYSRDLDAHGKNVIYCYADSSHTVPRSQGCHLTMMNGGAIQLASKKHTVTALSTCHDELIEFSKSALKACGFRNLMGEAAMHQEEPTIVYQDNEAAVKIETHRGSLSSRSKHIDLAVLSARNTVEDRKVIPIIKKTKEMLADIGTKALPDKQFAYLRDQINGYSLVKAAFPSYPMPKFVV